MSVKIRLNRRREEVIDKLANIVKEVKKDENVGCVLLTKYKGEEPSCVKGNVLELIVLTKDGNFDNDRLTEIYYKYAFDTKFNIVIFPQKYDEYLNVNTRLFNSSIIYDKNGEFTKLKQQMDTAPYTGDRQLIRYGNSIDLIPPIEEELKLKLEDKVEE